MKTKLPVISIPHGGGPWPLMKDAFGDSAPFDRLENHLKELGNQLKDRIKALLVISAHWEESAPKVHFGQNPGMLYDYGGFPEEAYEINWPAPGSPDTATRVWDLLTQSGFSPQREENRGYDHGTFIPLMLAFPEADIPAAQLSLVRGLSPKTHFNMGKALEPLREEGVLIIASGMSYHNMRGFGSRDPQVLETSQIFDSWLEKTVSCSNKEEREQRILDWEKAPGALECHPRSEHLVPLFVAAGAAGSDEGKVVFRDILMGTMISGHVFG